MINESTSTGDSAAVAVNGLVIPNHASLKALAGHMAALMTPADHFGHSLEELFDLYETRHHGGERVVSAATLADAIAPSRNAVRVRVHDRFGNLKQLILASNCRTNGGGTYLNILQGGDANANIGYKSSGNQTWTSSTVTPTTSPAWTTNQWAGHILVPLSGEGKAHILSNTATALTFDQIYNITSTSGAAGSTPAANSEFVILDGQAPARWIVLSSNSTTEDISDSSFASEITTGFTTNPRWFGTWSQTTAPSGTGTTNSNATYKLDSGTQSANASNTVNKLYLTYAQNNGTPQWEKKLATAATVASGDTLDASWSVQCS